MNPNRELIKSPDLSAPSGTLNDPDRNASCYQDVVSIPVGIDQSQPTRFAGGLRDLMAETAEFAILRQIDLLGSVVQRGLHGSLLDADCQHGAGTRLKGRSGVRHNYVRPAKSVPVTANTAATQTAIHPLTFRSSSSMCAANSGGRDSRNSRRCFRRRHHFTSAKSWFSARSSANGTPEASSASRMPAVICIHTPQTPIAAAPNEIHSMPADAATHLRHNPVSRNTQEPA